MYKLSRRVNTKILPRHNKFVFGYELWSGRKTACMYLYNKHKTGLVLDNTGPYQEPVYEYNIKTMLEDMNKIFPNTNIYIAGVQDEEQFALFRHFGFTMIKINKPNIKVKKTTKWNFLRQDMLDFVHDDMWDVTIDNYGSLNDFYQEIEMKIFNNIYYNK